LTGRQLDRVLSSPLRHLSPRRRAGLDQTVACGYDSPAFESATISLPKPPA
jgi:hypothetical protein